MAIGLAAALMAAGCGGPPPCGPAACDDGSTCVMGMCQPRHRVPVGDDARRVVVFPGDVAAVAENLAGGAHATLPLGGRSAGDAAVYLAFVHGLDRDDDVEAAWVVVEPAAGAVTASAWIEVEARDIPRAFASASVDWARRPQTARPSSRARTRGAAGSTLRVDVTDLVRGWIANNRRDGRVALVADADADVGATFSTGLGAGPAPRLEIYLR